MLWWLLACAGDDPGDGPPPPDTDTDLTTETGTVDTDTDLPPPEYLEITDIFVEARFGFDFATQQIAVVERLNGLFEYPMIEVILATDRFTGDLAAIDTYCSILLVLESSTVADWVTADQRLVWGVDWDPLDPPLTNCNTEGYALNPFDWGLDPVLTFTNDPNWGVAVGLPTQGVVDALEPQLGPDMAFIVGGTIRVPDLLPGDPVESVWGYAYEVDADMVVVDADGDYVLDAIPADQVHDGTNLLRSAWITLYSLTAWSFG